MESEHDFSLSQIHSTWHCVRCDNEFKTEKESLDHFAKEHTVIIKEEPKTIKECKLIYFLDELKNMKVAKADARETSEGKHFADYKC